MKNFSTFKYICFLLFAILLVTSCEQDEIFMDQIAKPTGKGYYPVIASATVDPSNTLPAGNDFSIDLRFWSKGTIESISLMEVIDTDSTEVYSSMYNPAYSPVTRTDSLIIDYSIPASKPTGTGYVVKVINENALKRELKVLTVE